MPFVERLRSKVGAKGNGTLSRASRARPASSSMHYAIFRMRTTTRCGRFAGMPSKRCSEERIGFRRRPAQGLRHPACRAEIEL